MYDEIILLVSEVQTVDQYGDTHTEKEKRAVFAELKSVGQSEFYQANALGLKPEMKFVLADYLDYHGEMLIEYQPYEGDPEEYHVIRTYRKDDSLEIVCQRGVI